MDYYYIGPRAGLVYRSESYMASSVGTSIRPPIFPTSCAPFSGNGIPPAALSDRNHRDLSVGSRPVRKTWPPAWLYPHGISRPKLSQLFLLVFEKHLHSPSCRSCDTVAEKGHIPSPSVLSRQYAVDLLPVLPAVTRPYAAKPEPSKQMIPYRAALHRGSRLCAA